MILANEVYLIDTLKRLDIEPNKIKKIVESFEGWRIYIRKKPSEYERIRSFYNALIQSGYSRSEAIKELSRIFEKSESRIREITKVQRSLFECE